MNFAYQNFQFLLLEGSSYQCVMTLPPNADFQKQTGPLCRSLSLSKPNVSLEACKSSHKMGALTDQSLPNDEDPSENKTSKSTKEAPSGPGRTH